MIWSVVMLGCMSEYQSDWSIGARQYGICLIAMAIISSLRRSLTFKAR